MVGDCRDVAVKFTKDPADKSKKKLDMTMTFADSAVVAATAEKDSVAIKFSKPLVKAELIKDEKEKSTKLALTLDGGLEKSFPVDAAVVKSVALDGATLQIAVAPKLAEVKLGDKYPMVALPFNQALTDKLLAANGEAGKAISGKPATLTVIYSCGDYVAATNVVRSDDATAKPVEIKRDGALPSGKIESFFKNPFASLEKSKDAPLKIENALITPVPSTGNGWLTAIFIFVFIAFFAVGPGVCVWLALSELMPTRIRSNGMSIALLINQAVSTTIAAVFLPTVGKYGYGTMFFAFAGFTVIYFITAFFFLPETKGKTLEEIEEHFEGKHKKA
jgi:phage shock protein PspC (stress-responsive transcriptional regulator)